MEKTLNSIVCQLGRWCRCRIVDGGSVDDTENVVKALSEKNTRLYDIIKAKN